MGNQVSSCEPHHAWPQRQPSGNHRILQYYTAVWKVLRRIGQRTRHANILAVALPVAPIGSLIGARIIGLGLRASVDARGAECVAAVRLASSPLPPRRTNPASVRSSHPLADMEVSVSELEINNPFTPNPPPPFAIACSLLITLALQPKPLRPCLSTANQCQFRGPSSGTVMPNRGITFDRILHIGPIWRWLIRDRSTMHQTDAPCARRFHKLACLKHRDM